MAKPTDRFGSRSSSRGSDGETLHELGPRDVLLGRGTGPNDNPGNIWFREVVSRSFDEYSAVTVRGDKTRIAREILRTVHAEGGRFVQRKDKAVVVPESIAREDRTDQHNNDKGNASPHNNNEARTYVVVTDENTLIQKTKQAFRFIVRRNTSVAQHPQQQQKQVQQQQKQVQAQAQPSQLLPVHTNNAVRTDYSAGASAASLLQLAQQQQQRLQSPHIPMNASGEAKALFAAMANSVDIPGDNQSGCIPPSVVPPSSIAASSLVSLGLLPGNNTYCTSLTDNSNNSSRSSSNDCPDMTPAAADTSEAASSPLLAPDVFAMLLQIREERLAVEETLELLYSRQRRPQQQHSPSVLQPSLFQRLLEHKAIQSAALAQLSSVGSNPQLVWDATLPRSDPSTTSEHQRLRLPPNYSDLQIDRGASLAATRASPSSSSRSISPPDPSDKLLSTINAALKETEPSTTGTQDATVSATATASHASDVEDRVRASLSQLLEADRTLTFANNNNNNNGSSTLSFGSI